MSQFKAKRSSEKHSVMASVQSTEVATVRMNVNLSKAFYKQVKQRALDEDSSITEIVRKALSEYMSR